MYSSKLFSIYAISDFIDTSKEYPTKSVLFLNKNS